MSQRTAEVGGEKRVGEWIDAQVDWLQTLLFRYRYLSSVFRIHDILVWIRIRKRIRFLLFSLLTFKTQTKNNLKKSFSA